MAADRPVLDGRWDTKFEYLQRDNVSSSPSERRWVFRRHPESKSCKLRLSYELALGGFDKICLRRIGSKYVGRSVGTKVRCHSGYVDGRTVERFSVRVLGSRVVDGVRLASSIEAYYRASYTIPAGVSPRCAGTAREVRRFTGTRIDLPGDESDAG